MANFRWTGAAGDGNIQTAGNYAGGAAPSADADNLYFDTNVDPNTGHPTNGTLAFAFGEIVVSPGVNVAIGNDSGQPTFGGAGDTIPLIRLAGTARRHRLACGADAVTRLSCELGTGQQVHLISGTYTTTVAERCEVLPGASAVTTNIRVMRGGKVVAATNGTAITLLELDDASSAEVTSRAITTVYVEGASNLTTKGSTVVTTGHCTSGSTYNKQSAATDTTWNLRGRGSKITPAGYASPATANTITTLNRHGTATLIKSAGGATLTVTNDNLFGTESDTNNTPITFNP